MKNKQVPMLLFLLLSFLIFGCMQVNTAPAPAPSLKAVMPDNASISLELATTRDQVLQGLSGRDSLCESCGMLFIFPEPAPRGFWMSGMKFPLDMIFMSANRTVLNLAENVQPCAGECLVLRSRGAAAYVLEVNAGFAKKHGVEEGSAINLTS
ncbi:MAG: DUF192 domain-containing protein [Candidatus Micrarchaeia archaeon]|jgi:hypothetical protein